MNDTLFFVIMLAATILAVVTVVQSKLQSLLGWACAVGFGALAWNAAELL